MADVFEPLPIRISLLFSRSDIFPARFTILAPAPRPEVVSLVRSLTLRLFGNRDLPVANIPGKVERSKSRLRVWVRRARVFDIPTPHKVDAPRQTG